MTAVPSPGAYIALRREADGRSIEDVAADFRTEPKWPEHERAAWLRRIEAGEEPISLTTIATLRFAFPFDLQVLLSLADVQNGIADAAPQICRVCGCSEHDPCVDSRLVDIGLGACAWAEEDRCTACPPLAGSAAA